MATGDIHKFRRLLFRNAWRDNTTQRVMSDLLEFSKPQVRAIFEAIAAEGASPVLIHGPKNGFVICLILIFLNVAEEKIVHDNEISDRWKSVFTEKRKEYLETLGVDPNEEPHRDCTASEFVGVLLEHLETRYKGIDAYLDSIGLTQFQLQQIRNNLQKL